MSSFDTFHWPTHSGLVNVILALVLVPILYMVCSGCYYAFVHPLSHVPGPKLYAVSQLPYMYHLLRGDWHDKLRCLHEQYGPTVRFGPIDVSFIKAEAMTQIFGHKKSSSDNFEKDPIFYTQDSSNYHIMNSSNDDHRRMRRLLAHAFSEKALRGQLTVMNKYVDMFVDKLAIRARQGETLDIVKWYNFATFDLIGDLGFGEPFDCLDSGGWHPWVRLVFVEFRTGPFYQVARRFGLRSLVHLFVPKSLRRGAAEHYQLAAQTAMKRIDSGNIEREDFMSYILRHNDDKQGMSKKEIVTNAAVLIAAGSETTATLLSGVTFHLLTSPRVYNELARVLRSTFESEEDMTLPALTQLQYLSWVLNEGLRMYPPVPSSLPRLVPEGGQVVMGYHLPEKTSVSVPHWPAFRSALNFRDPDTFVPERWNGDDPRYVYDDKNMLQPFSAGPRNCIGKNLAYAEMRLMLARLLWRFDLELMADSLEWDKQRVFVLWEKGELNVKLTEVQR